jgi:hypothetical protein
LRVLVKRKIAHLSTLVMEIPCPVSLILSLGASFRVLAIAFGIDTAGSPLRCRILL